MKKTFLNFLLLLSGFAAYSQNNALSFDGVDDQVYFATHGINASSNFTVQLDVLNKNTSPDTDVYLQFFDATNGRLELRFDNGKLSVLTPNMGTQLVSNFVVPVDKYFNVTFVKNSSGSTLYANGAEVLSIAGNYNVGSTLKVGRYFAQDGFSFKGEIDELRLWNTAKTPAEIINNPCSLTGSEVNLVGYYDFNQGVAGGTNTGITTLTDKSPSKINGTSSGFALTGAASNWVANTIAKCNQVNENALSFDGTNDQVSFPTHGLIGMSNFTIQVDVLNKNTNPDEDVFLQFFDQTNGRFELRLDNGKLSVLAPTIGLQLLSNYTVPVDKYFNVTFIKSGTSSKMYVNGTEVLSFTGTYMLGTTLRVGRYFAEDVYSFKGELDELRLWNTAKTANEISKTSCSLTGSETNLVGYYDFNQGIAGATNTSTNTLIDKSISKMNGTLANFDLVGPSSNWVASTNCSSVVTGMEADQNGTRTNIYLYPNPATNWLETKNVNAASFIEIYSATGQLILTANAGNRIELPASMEPGMYIANIKGEKVANLVFVKQ